MSEPDVGIKLAESRVIDFAHVMLKGYAAILKRVQRSCSKNPWHRGAVMALEGGYNPNVSASCAAACMKIAMANDNNRSELPCFVSLSAIVCSVKPM